MNMRVMKNGRKCSLYGSLLTGMAYAALALNSTPVLASSTCTAENCAFASEMAEFVCENFGGVYFFYCEPGTSTGWQFVCREGLGGGDYC